MFSSYFCNSSHIKCFKFLLEMRIGLICDDVGDPYAVMKNPANLAKHQANPKVAPIIAKMMSKFAG